MEVVNVVGKSGELFVTCESDSKCLLVQVQV